MGSILQNSSVIQKRHFSARQREYLGSIKNDSRRRRIIRHELSIQKELCDWFINRFPGEHFISDTGSGAFGKWAKDEHNKQQSHKHEPDVKILAARRGYHGLLLELKADGFELRMRRDGHKIRVYRDSQGKIIARDHKIRKKGDWVNMHVEGQARILNDYESKGYCSRFSIGLEAAKKWICWYFGVPYEPPIENGELF